MQFYVRKSMKTVFILNPRAGKGHGIDRIKSEVMKAAEELSADAGFYMTKSVGDAEIFAGLASSEAVRKGEKLRLIACGGDGTLNEVINGAAGAVLTGSERGESLVSVGVVPTGTGNDFVRNFKDAGDYMDPRAQIKGGTLRCDLIRYTGMIDGREQSRFCANMFNIGFDCNVVDMTAKVKEYPLMKGTLAYMASVLAILVKKKGAFLRIEADGQVVHDGPVLLTAVANGCYCGGGVKGLPRASLTDGLIDLSIIYDVSRREFLKKFPYYARGTHLELPGVEEIISYRQCKDVTITPPDDTMRLCVDGEIYDAGPVHMRVIPSAIDIVVPAK